MKKVKGTEYTIKVRVLENFAKVILTLTNIKSSYKGRIHSIRTYEGTNLITYITYGTEKGILMAFESAFDAEVSSTEDVDIIKLEWEDIADNAQELLGAYEDEGQDIEELPIQFLGEDYE